MVSGTADTQTRLATAIHGHGKAVQSKTKVLEKSQTQRQAVNENIRSRCGELNAVCPSGEARPISRDESIKGQFGSLSPSERVISLHLPL